MKRFSAGLSKLNVADQLLSCVFCMKFRVTVSNLRKVYSRKKLIVSGQTSQPVINTFCLWKKISTPLPNSINFQKLFTEKAQFERLKSTGHFGLTFVQFFFLFFSSNYKTVKTNSYMIWTQRRPQVLWILIANALHRLVATYITLRSMRQHFNWIFIETPFQFDETHDPALQLT